MKNDSYNKELYAMADKAGKDAAEKCVPTPMVVRNSMTGKVYKPVLGGVCGFAWINIRPGNCSYANWLKKNGFARPAYGGGVDVWVGDYNQSLEKKSEYAGAFARTVRETGINANARSRMD